jgi:magnesium transporter
MLINCAAYADGKRVETLDLNSLDRAKPGDGRFIWVALKDAEEEEFARLQQHFGLHPLAIEDAMTGHQRPKLEEYGTTLFSVIQLLERVDSEISVGEIDVFIDRDFILSFRSGSNQDFLGVRQRCETEPELLRHGPGYVFYAMLDHVVDRYFELTESLQSELESIEDDIFVRPDARRHIERLFKLKQQCKVLRHAALPMSEFIGKLYGGRVPPVCAQSQEYFRDVHDHLARIVGALDTVRESIATAIQVNLSMVTIEESEVTKRLAAWAAIFAASTALAGIWGMNFEHMPELTWTWGYPLALCIIGTVAGLLYRRFRKAGWL